MQLNYTQLALTSLQRLYWSTGCTVESSELICHSYFDQHWEMKAVNRKGCGDVTWKLCIATTQQWKRADVGTLPRAVCDPSDPCTRVTQVTRVYPSDPTASAVRSKKVEKKTDVKSISKKMHSIILYIRTYLFVPLVLSTGLYVYEPSARIGTIYTGNGNRQLYLSL